MSVSVEELKRRGERAQASHMQLVNSPDWSAIGPITRERPAPTRTPRGKGLLASLSYAYARFRLFLYRAWWNS